MTWALHSCPRLRCAPPENVDINPFQKISTHLISDSHRIKILIYKIEDRLRDLKIQDDTETEAPFLK